MAKPGRTRAPARRDTRYDILAAAIAVFFRHGLHRVTVEDVASWLIRYRIRDNVTEELEVPSLYEDRMDERIFAAAFPKSEIDDVLACVRD